MSDSEAIQLEQHSIYDHLWHNFHILFSSSSSQPRVHSFALFNSLPHMCDMKNEIFSWRQIFQAFRSGLFYSMLNCCLACSQNILLLSYAFLWYIRACMYRCTPFRLASCRRIWTNYNPNSFHFICVPWHMHHVHKTAFKVSLLMHPFPFVCVYESWSLWKLLYLHWNIVCAALRNKVSYCRKLFRLENLFREKSQSN